MMSVLEKISKTELREFMSKGWMTHDAMWYLNCLQEFGIDKANKMNLAAISSMSVFEVARIKEVLGYTKDRVESFDELMKFLDDAFDLLIPEFMRFSYTISAKNTFSWSWKKNDCFAYKGISRIGMLDQYQCGVMRRITCWLDNLDVKYEIKPEVKGCLMHETGACNGDIFCHFPDN